MADPAPSLHTHDMHQFLDRWRDGDRAAADDLIRRAEARFQRLARQLYRGFPNIRGLAETGDVIQDSWLRLLNSLRSLRPENTRDFYRLAAVHIRRELLDLARRAKSRRLEHAPLTVAGAGGSSSGVPVADEKAAEDLDLWVRFHEAVGRLDAAKREVVSLVFYHGRTQAEIAAWFGKDERTIRRWWADACSDLRALVVGTHVY